MTATSALDMIGVDCAAFESCSSLFDEAGFVKGVAMKFALNIVLIADPALTD